MYFLTFFLIIGLVYLFACAIVYPLQYAFYYGIDFLKDMAVIPESYTYTMDMAMEHAEIAFGSLVVAFILYKIIKFFFIYFSLEK